MELAAAIFIGAVSLFALVAWACSRWLCRRDEEPRKPDGEPYKLQTYGGSFKPSPEQLREITDERGNFTVPGVTVVRAREQKGRRPL